MFDPCDSKNLNLSILKGLCKFYHIRGYSSLRKASIISLINQHIACRLIQKNYRQSFYKDAQCNIGLGPVGWPCFVYIPKPGKRIFYAYDQIIPYIIKSGDCRDACTRIMYSDKELKNLDSQAKTLGFRYRSTLKIKKNKKYHRSIRERQNAILALEGRIEELLESLEVIVENNVFEWAITETFYVDSIAYRNVEHYIQELVSEIRVRVRTLWGYDRHTARELYNSILNRLDAHRDKIINLPESSPSYSLSFPENYESLRTSLQILI